MKRLYYILLTLFCLATLNAQAQVVVESKLDRTAILVGEQARLTTTVTTTGAKQVKFRDFTEGDTLLTGVEVLSCGNIDTLAHEGNRLRLRRTYTITSFDSALYALPPMQVEVDGKTYASRGKLGLKVATVPVDTTHVNQFAPPFTVVPEPFQLTAFTSSWEAALSWTLLFLPWVFLLVLLFAATKLTGHKPLRRRMTIYPPTPPYKKAAEAMEALKSEVERATTYDDNKLFFVRLTDILRRYITERYGFNALEKTTQEIMDGLRQLRLADPSGTSEGQEATVPAIDSVTLDKLRTVFTTADFVKFAKHTSTDVERRQAFNAVSELLLTTHDEAQERPRPIVRYVTFSNRSQHRVRVAMWVTLIASAVLLVAATAVATYFLCDTYA